MTPVPFNAEGPAAFPYPLPQLQISGPLQERAVSTVVLQNEATRIVICPDLGGRVVEWADQEILMPAQMTLTTGGDQGLEWRHGIAWRPVGGARAELGPVHAELRPPHEDSLPGGVVLSGMTEDGNYLWRVAVALEPQGSEVKVEGHVFQIGFRATRFSTGWSSWDGLEWKSDQVGFPGRRVAWTRNLAAPSHCERSCLQWPGFPIGSEEYGLEKASQLVGMGQTTYSFHPPLLEAWSGRIDAENAVLARDWSRVVERVDSALEFNARDHRLWWLRSVAARKLGQDDEGALANAIYLWADDPILKAESVLATPPSDNGAPHPMVDRMKGDPAAMVEVAVQLCRLQLDDDLSRWVHECLKVREVPMLRYALAFALLTRSRFDAQAAEHVVLAARQPLAPPFPSRPFERLVLQTLAQRFKTDKRLPVLMGLLGDQDSADVGG